MIELTPTQIKHLLESFKVTQAQIATSAGVTPQTVCLVFAGKRKSANVMKHFKKVINAKAKNCDITSEEITIIK